VATATVPDHEPGGVDRQALADYLAGVCNRQSELGGLDCVRFVVEALLAGFSVDLRGKLRYADRQGALRRIRHHRGLDAAFRYELGEPLPAEELRFGDIAYVPPHAVGLVMPGYIAMKARATIWRYKLSTATHGWRVI